MRVQCKVNNDNKHPTVRSDGGSQKELLLEELLKNGFKQGSLYPHLEIHASSHRNSSFQIINSVYSSVCNNKAFDLALPWVLEPIKEIIGCACLFLFCFVLCQEV